ncbi:MAG TPA: glycerophosphodiester phosphodiesterase [Candidatus Acidoferrum sp.]|nr:glycerophosphodiester phosphodiesterase [Candidatus Acidoferrum sp.]
MRFILPLLLLLCAADLQAADRKLVIAHRGASGYLPEHTLEGKALAFAMGADYLEQDVVMTRDDQLIVMHDLTLERTTDVATVFPGRQRKDGSFYVVDFTLAELRRLNVHEGTNVVNDKPQAIFSQRFPIDRGTFRLHTLQEEIELVQGLEKSTGRKVGIYPELKSPWFYHQHGKDLARAVLTVLKQYGYTTKDAPVYLQTFDHHELLRVRNQLFPEFGMQLKLVQLIADNDWNETFEQDQDGNWQPYDYRWMLTPAGMQQLGREADGIGPEWDMLLEPFDQNAKSVKPNGLTAAAHQAGLQVHPYTFRKDAGQLPAFAASLQQFIHYFLFDVGVDGVFTDYTDIGVAAAR